MTRSTRKIRLSADMVLFCSGLAILAGVAGSSIWNRWTAPVPPVADLSDAEPVVRMTILQARENVVRSPASPSNWGRLGMFYLAHGFDEQALVCLAEAGRIDADEARWSYLEGVVRLQTDQPDEAINAFRRAARMAPDESVATLRIGEALLKTSRSEEAEATYRDLLSRHPENLWALIGLGQALLSRGKYKEALVSLQRAESLAPRIRKTHTLLSQVYQRVGDTEAAASQTQLLESLPELDCMPDPYLGDLVNYEVGLASLLTRINTVSRQGDNENLLQLAREVARLHPHSGQAHQALGQSLLIHGRTKESESSLRTALQLEPNLDGVHLSLGSALAQQGRLEEAITAYRDAIDLQPQQPLAHQHLGKCLFELQRWEEAASALRSALQYTPDHSESHRLLATAFWENGELIEALEHAERAVSIDPTDPANQQLLQLIQDNQTAGIRRN